MSILLDSPDPDTFRILLATDNHLGFGEKDPVRQLDSFRTFEEIMRIALSNQVDFVLLGGDVFHDNKPSRFAYNTCFDILNKYVMGTRELKFEIVSDQKVNFPDQGIVNYEDVNVNIGLPIFSIHGNHDDPSGVGGKSAINLLSAAKLVNYFGNASENPNEISLVPILLEKGSIKDERLNRTFASNNVSFVRPAENELDWFNIFVLHQNRVEHSTIYKNVIPETALPKFLDLVFWGHEHECVMDLRKSDAGGFFIIQPGSSVTTQLTPGEAETKKVGILEVRQDKCRIIPVPLKTIRPFIIEDVILGEVKEIEGRLQDSKAISEYLASRVETLILEAANPTRFPIPEVASDLVIPQDMNERLPLIRLRVDYTGSVVLNPQRFGQDFIKKVANPSEILHFHKKRSTSTKTEQLPGAFGDISDFLEEKKSSGEVISVIDIMKKNLPGMHILPDLLMMHKLEEFVKSEDSNDVFDMFLSERLEKVRIGLFATPFEEKEDMVNFVLKETATANEEASASDKSIPIVSKNTVGVSKKVTKATKKKSKADDSDSDEAGDTVPAKRSYRAADVESPKVVKKRAAAKVATKKKFVESDQSDDENVIVSKKVQVRRKAPASEDIDTNPLPKRSRAKSAATNDSIDLVNSDADDVVVVDDVTTSKPVRTLPLIATTTEKRKASKGKLPFKD